MSENNIQQKVAEIKRDYFRNWRKNNKDKVKEINKRYWEKKAQQLLSEEKNA